MVNTPGSPPRLGFGCVSLGSASGGRTAKSDVALVREAVDRGVTLFDTADAYGNGSSERVLGAALHGQRSEVEIATKAGYLFDERSRLRQATMSRLRPMVDLLRSRRSEGAGHDGPRSSTYADKSFSGAHLRSALDASLRRLQTDYVDVFQLHGPPVPSASMVEEIAPVVDELVRSGKVRRFGIGAESVSSAHEWLAVARVDVVQVPFGLLDPQAVDEIFPAVRDRGAEAWVRGVLGGGVLSAFVRGDASARQHPKRELIAALSEVAQRAGISLFQLAVDYARSFADVSTILIGMHSSDHLAETVRMMARPLSDRAVIAEAQEITTRWVGLHESC